jgi:outer membrane protein assembly factor BamB
MITAPAAYHCGMPGSFTMSRRIAPLLLLLTGLLTVQIAAQRIGRRAQVKDWPQFGWDVASSGSPPGSTGITAANAASLIRRRVEMDGAVDASAIYLHDVTVNGSTHDVFFVTTTYGKSIALDADTGAVLWEYTPPGFAAWVGTSQITNSTPAADPDRQHIYAAAPDGTVQKLAIVDGHVVWTTPITLLPRREKIASPLKVYQGRVIAVTGGYIGDAPPYQGHVAVLDAQTGALQHVWNSLCSDRAGLIQPGSCPSTRSAIWGRAGAVIDPATGNIFVATGNGPYNGKTDWGDSVIELDPEATRVLGNYSPVDNATLNAQDIDLGSTSPVLLGGGVLAQGGKDARIRMLSIAAIRGVDPHTGNELQTMSTPSHNMLFTAPAVWRGRADTWMFAADNGGAAAWKISAGQFTRVSSNSTAGTSPVVAGGLLYIYDPNGALHVYDPAEGKAIASLSCGRGHWNSPIVADGRIALPEGNANEHATVGVLNIWSVSPPQ